VLRRMLNRASRSPRARRAVESFPPTRRVVDRFVAGECSDAAIAVARDLLATRMWTSLDLLGEDVSDPSGARATRDSYVALLHALDEAGCALTTEVSLKLSAVGQALPDSGEEIALAHAQEICAVAKTVGSMVTLDMEDHTTVDSTLRVADQLRREYPQTGTVLQSNLKRTEGDLANLARCARSAGSSIRVRLVKGAYKEPSSVAYQRKADVDLAYKRGIDAAMSGPLYAMVATHDPVMLEFAGNSANEQGRGCSDFEIQMLYGIRTDLQHRIVDSSQRMRVYVPFGTDWYPYFMRRLAERPANVAFLLRALARR
jgi:proline dehydrogenase